jgi:putative addiction module component (TIGR02574 family)
MSLEEYPELTKLSTSKKILLVEQLWESIRSDPSSFPIPNCHKDELDNRLESLDPDQLLDLNELKARVEKNK